MSIVMWAAGGAAHAATLAPGDLVVGLGSSADGAGEGQLRHFSRDGTLLDTMLTTSGSFEETGACVDSAGTLYTTNFEANTVSVFDSTGALLVASFGPGFDQHPNSCLLDGAGNLYVAQSDRNGSFGGGGVLKLSPAGALLGSFSPAVEARGTDWMDMAANQCTLYYTSVGATIQRFDVCANEQLPPFCIACDDGAGGATSGPLLDLRLLPDDGLLVVDAGAGVVRRYDASQNQTMTYAALDAYGMFFPWSLALDLDGTSFWVADYLTGEIFRFDLATGQEVQERFAAGDCDAFFAPCAITGLAVVGEPRAAVAPPSAVRVTATITAASRVYDTTAAAAITNCTVTGAAAGDDVGCEASGAVFDSPSAGTGKTVTANVALTGTAASRYALASTTVTTAANITPAPASVTPDAASKVYGTGDPAFAGALSGFFPSDGVTATYSRAAGESVMGGPYAISATLSSAASATQSRAATRSALRGAFSDVLANYAITYNTAALAITPAAASVTTSAASKPYGAADPALTGVLGGFLPADGVTAQYTRAPGETVSGGPYAITATLSPASVLGNYTITRNSAALAITAIAASVTPSAASKVYGTADPALTGVLSGFLPADGVTAQYTRTAGETATGGPYVISAALSPAGALGNYTIAYNTAGFAIVRANASVTPTASSKTYGAPDPPLTGSLAGFLASDGVSAAFSRTPGESVAGSPYAISATLSPASVLGNYAITYNTADFTISQALADVSVTLTTPTPAVDAGAPISYAVLVSTSGPGGASDVMLTDALPAGLGWTVGGADAGACGVSGPAPGETTLTCRFGTLAPGASRSITLAAVTTPTNCGVIANTANVTSASDANGADPNLANNSSGPVNITVNCACKSLPCQVPAKDPANVVTVQSCAPPAVTTYGNWTQINMPTADVVLQCALSQMPGTTGVRVIARSIKVDGADAAHPGSITTTGVQGIQLTASAPTCRDATIEVLSASLDDGNSNGGIKLTACGEIVINSSMLASAGQNVTVSSTGGRICADSDSFAGNTASFTSQGDLWMRNSSVLTVGPRDQITLTSTGGNVMAGGGAGPAPCLPNQFKGQNESNLAFTASGIVDQTNSCIDIAEAITIRAGGAGKDCAADTIIDMTGAEVRNDFGKTGTIDVSACSNQGRIDISGAILVDTGAKGGGPNPNAVASLNGGKVTASSCPAIASNPPRAACSTRAIAVADNPVCADPADRASHQVVGQPLLDR